ncbi:PYRD-like protein [Mya arenaria]|uniref:Dihydroorotate dehydrogenase (quinone), mitochondrial n=1 Tax=Mya arenaria TaxID=6604 RepID=A0ABY7ETB1_MYAAR|nr:PYRD-like protein [Mya arenaria]
MGARNQTTFMKQLKEMALIVGGGSLAFVGIQVYNGNERFYRDYIMPCVMRCLDPESAHNLAIFIAKHKLVPKQNYADPASLQTKVWDREFSNPVGVAAGFDKDGVGVDAMLESGFGFVEVGSVTPKPQPGNPKPRLFRLVEDKAMRSTIRCGGVVGVNLGKNKTSDSLVGDYVEGVREFAPLADYLVVNVSSPNTPGLRSLQGRQQLEELIAKGRVDGLIVSNTTVSRPDSLQSKHKSESGGLSGEPLKTLATQTIVDIGQDAYEKIRAGASLVQLYSALVYQGPPVVKTIKRELAELLEKDGFTSVSQAVGAGLKDV